MRTLLALLSLITLATAAPQEGDTILGKCVSVTDADTISLLVDKSVYKVRLSGIDAPERGQEYGTKATQALASKVKKANSSQSRWLAMTGIAGCSAS